MGLFGDREALLFCRRLADMAIRANDYDEELDNGDGRVEVYLLPLSYTSNRLVNAISPTTLASWCRLLLHITLTRSQQQ